MNFGNQRERLKFKRALKGVWPAPGWAGLAACIIGQAVEDYFAGDPAAAAWFICDDWYKNLVTLLDLPADWLPAPVAADVGQR